MAILIYFTYLEINIRKWKALPHSKGTDSTLTNMFNILHSVSLVRISLSGLWLLSSFISKNNDSRGSAKKTRRGARQKMIWRETRDIIMTKTCQRHRASLTIHFSSCKSFCFKRKRIVQQKTQDETSQPSWPFCYSHIWGSSCTFREDQSRHLSVLKQNLWWSQIYTLKKKWFYLQLKEKTISW